jgi:acyl carrier protein
VTDADELTRVEATLLEWLAEFADDEMLALTNETSLDGLALDSLDITELGVQIDEQWRVELRAEDLDDVRTVGDLSRLIVKHLTAQ